MDCAESESSLELLDIKILDESIGDCVSGGEVSRRVDPCGGASGPASGGASGPACGGACQPTCGVGQDTRTFHVLRIA